MANRLHHDYKVEGNTVLLLRKFTIGISLCGSHCFLADVGRGSESADEKVRAWLVDSLLDVDCKHVYLGGLDDYSYASDLAGLKVSS